MYTLPRDFKITKEIIQDIIDYSKKSNKRFDMLKNYYIGKQVILDRYKDATLKNNKVVINHAKFIVDTNTGYLLGNPVEYQPTDGYDIEPILDVYKKNGIKLLE